MPPSNNILRQDIRDLSTRLNKEQPVLPFYDKKTELIVSLFMGFLAVVVVFVYSFSKSLQNPAQVKIPWDWSSFDSDVRWEFDHGIEHIQTTRPLNIAHRGHSGAMPEETLEAYQMAVSAGADIIECDACLTKDLQVVCAHESWINKTTDVADRFSAERSAEYFVPDRNGGGTMVHDYFTVDFTLDELKKLTKVEPKPYRDQNNNGLFKIATLEEMIKIAKSANHPVGIHVEIKDPVFVNNASESLKVSGKKFEDVVVEVLHKNGYNKKSSPCFIQSFDENSLKYVSSLTPLPLILLIGYPGDVSEEHLKRVAEFAYGIGPDKRHLALINQTTRTIVSHSNLVKVSHGLGLKLHIYTFRNEHEFLAWNYRQDPYNEYADFFRLGIDGYFTDFPDTLQNFLDVIYTKKMSSSSSPSLTSSHGLIYLSILLFLLLLG